MSESPTPQGAWQPPSAPSGTDPSPSSPTGWGQPAPSGWGPAGAGSSGVLDGPPAWGAPGYGAAAGSWQPPPQPGVVPLRPLGLGELIDGSVQTMRQNPRVMFGLSALVMAITVVASTVLVLVGLPRLASGFDGLEQGAGSEQIAPLVSGGVIIVVLPIVLQYLAVIVLTGILILAVSDAVLGRRPSVGQVWRRARPRLLALVGLSLLTGFLQALAVVACIAPGVSLLLVSGLAGGLGLLLGVPLAVVVVVWLWVRFAFAAPALLLEELGVRAAVRRSWQLGYGSFWRVLGVLVLAAIIGGVANALLSVPFAVLGGVVAALTVEGDTATDAVYTQVLTQGVSNIGTILATTVSAPFAAAVTALLYIDLRIRREGLDVALAKAAATPRTTTA